MTSRKTFGVTNFIECVRTDPKMHFEVTHIVRRYYILCITIDFGDTVTSLFDRTQTQHHAAAVFHELAIYQVICMKDIFQYLVYQ